VGKILNLDPEGHPIEVTRVLWRRLKAVGELCSRPIIASGAALGSIFLIPAAWIGAILWFSFVLNLRAAVFALLALGIAYGIGRALKIADEPHLGGGLKANALLTAVAVAWLLAGTEISVQGQVGLVIASAAVTCILAAAIIHALGETNLPSLVWAYCAVASALFVLFPEWTATAAAATSWPPLPTDAIDWIRAFLASLGSILYAPKAAVGIVVCVAILLWSRTLFVTGTIGWLSGVGTALALENLGVSYDWLPAAYNYFLAGAALGAVFFLPGRASLFVAAAAGSGASVLALLLQHLLAGSAIAFLPISLGLTVSIGIAALTLASGKGALRRNYFSQMPPEMAWWHAAYWSQRFGEREPLVVVPVPGAAIVSQGFNGPLSHAGLWRHALDFQRSPDAAAGDKLVDSIWGAPVFAPAAGIVERTVTNVPDNPAGVSNYSENWGNYVVIRLDQGGWAMLAHLRQGSVAVVPGTRVEIGTPLGEVGNSGRSPISHLHLQVQNSPDAGAQTIPFRLANYQFTTGTAAPLLRWNAAAVPDEGTIVSGAWPNPAVHHVLASIAPGSGVWVVESKGRIPREFCEAKRTTTLRVNVSIDEAGRHVYKTATSSALISNLDADGWRVIELKRAASPLLKLLALAVPVVPFAASAGLSWTEPVPVISRGAAGWLRLMLSPYLGHPFRFVRSTCVSEPDGATALTIETCPVGAAGWLPSSIICQFDFLRGPVRVEARFPQGTLTYSQLSFEPGIPLEDSQPS
jgi:murein DD-endopeptidase MepM/ murein hydrolase activator NlpD